VPKLILGGFCYNLAETEQFPGGKIFREPEVGSKICIGIFTAGGVRSLRDAASGMPAEVWSRKRVRFNVKMLQAGKVKIFGLYWKYDASGRKHFRAGRIRPAGRGAYRRLCRTSVQA
jgi:hypothetical protein